MNCKIDSGLQAALSSFIAKGIKDGAALDSVVFSHNNFTDEQLSELLKPMSMPGSKTKSLVSIKNPIGPNALKAILKIIKPEKELYVGEPFKNKNLQELVLNDSKLLQQEMMQELVGALSSCCAGTLKRLGLAN